ncbi:MAG TPA: DUF4097 family beta strand repeat-containing protein [Cerasibacillus sp.]|uniref:DUF4097 family beta strand repeat-containing protein n=1 Tax=Cerasibacillus sp. TaxID=2498711 RepID=UPI002F4111D8
MRHKTRLIAGILIIIGLIGIIITGGDLFMSNKEQSGKEVISDANINQVHIKSDVATINLLPSASDDIEVAWEGSKTRQHNLTIRQDDKTLEIVVEADRGFFSRIFSFGFFDYFLNVSIYLPERHYEHVSINSDVGNVSITSLDVNHLVSKTDVANMTIKNIKADVIDVKTNVGNVNLSNVTGAINAQSDVGKLDLKLKEITDHIQLTSDVGKISMSLPEIPNNVSFIGSSNIGKISIFGQNGNYMNSQADFTVDMRTDVGKIDVHTAR